MWETQNSFLQLPDKRMLASLVARMSALLFQCQINDLKGTK